MMKKRILASSMASVMALTSVAAVAFAEDATTEVDYAATEVVTAKELKGAVQGYVEQKFGQKFDNFIGSGVYNYGSRSAQKFVEVIDYVKTIWGDTSITTEEASAAYQMVKAAGAKVAYHSEAELKGLLEEAKAVYSTDNKLVGGLDGDKIYYDTPWYAFKAAYDDATLAAEGSDERGWTDAYEALYDALNTLNLESSKKTVVTKDAYGKAKEAFEDISAVKYDTWRRGTINLDNATLCNGGLKDSYNGKVTAYGTLYAHINQALGGIDDKYKDFTANDSASRTTNDAIVEQYKIACDGVTIINSFVKDNTDAASSNDVAKLINQYKSRLVYDTNANGALAVAGQIYNVVNAASNSVYSEKNGATALTTFTDKDTLFVNGTTEIVANGVNHLSTDVSANVYFNNATGDSTLEICIGLDADGNVALDGTTHNPVIATKADEATVKSNAAVKGIKILKAGEKIDLSKMVEVTATVDTSIRGIDSRIGNGVVDGDTMPTAPFKAVNTEEGGFGWYLDNTTWKTTTAGTLGGVANIETNVPVDSKNWHKVTGVSTSVNIQDALKLALAYQKANKTNDFDKLNNNGATAHSSVADLDILNSKIDTSGVLSRFVEPEMDTTQGTTAVNYLNKGAAAEWTIVNRYLKYALEDRYATPGTQGEAEYHTRDEVDTLIKKCDDLARKTEGAKIFSDALKAMTDAREDARAWSKNAWANKSYTDKKGSQTTVAFDEKNKTLNGTTNIGKSNASEMYIALRKKYNALEDLYLTWNLSYGEVRDEIGKASAVLKETGDEALNAAIDACAYALTEVEGVGIQDIVADYENVAFSFDSKFQANNRLKCRNYSGAANEETHKALFNAYVALKAAEEAALAAPEGILGDVDGDGTVTPRDASKLLKALLDDTASELKNADFDGDGTVTPRDASAILRSLLEA